MHTEMGRTCSFARHCLIYITIFSRFLPPSHVGCKYSPEPTLFIRLTIRRKLIRNPTPPIKPCLKRAHNTNKYPDNIFFLSPPITVTLITSQSPYPGPHLHAHFPPPDSNPLLKPPIPFSPRPILHYARTQNKPPLQQIAAFKYPLQFRGAQLNRVNVPVFSGLLGGGRDLRDPMTLACLKVAPCVILPRVCIDNLPTTEIVGGIIEENTGRGGKRRKWQRWKLRFSKHIPSHSTHPS